MKRASTSGPPASRRSGSDSAGAYREPAPLGVWQLRRPRGAQAAFQSVAVVPLALLSVLLAVALLRGAAARGPTLVFLVFGASLLVVMVLSLVASLSSGYASLRVNEARLELYPTHLLVPDEQGRPLRLPLSELSVGISSQEVSFNFVTIGRVEILELSAGRLQRRLSSQLFGGEAALRDAAERIQAQLRSA